jgi:hypothetical protein
MKRYRIVYRAKNQQYYPQYSWCWGLIWFNWEVQVHIELYEYISFDTYDEAANFLKRHCEQKLGQQRQPEYGSIYEFSWSQLLKELTGKDGNK